LFKIFPLVVFITPSPSCCSYHEITYLYPPLPNNLVVCFHFTPLLASLIAISPPNLRLYCAILDEELQESLHYHNKSPSDVIFQQDNDPKHTRKRAQNWFKDHGFTVMKWPAQSSDINPIEHLWWYLKQRPDEYENPPKSLQELWERCEAEWEKIPKEVCQNLIESMPRRVAAVLRAKGGHTKY